MKLIDYKSFKLYPIEYNRDMDNAVTILITFYKDCVNAILYNIIRTPKEFIDYKHLRLTGYFNDCPLCNVIIDGDNTNCSKCIYSILAMACIAEPINHNNIKYCNSNKENWTYAISNRIDMLEYLQIEYRKFKTDNNEKT